MVSVCVDSAVRPTIWCSPWWWQSPMVFVVCDGTQGSHFRVQVSSCEQEVHSMVLKLGLNISW